MTEQRRRINDPPAVNDPSLGRWTQDIADEFNNLIPTSHFSAATPESEVTAERGTLGITAASDVSAVWVKTLGSSNTGWESLAYDSRVSAAEDRLVLLESNMTLGYAGMLVNDGNTQTANVDQSAVTVAGFQETFPERNASADTANTAITVEVAGLWEVFCQSSFSGNNNTEYRTHLYVNGSEHSLGHHRKLSSAGDVGSASFAGMVKLAANDVLNIRSETVAGSGNFFGLVDAQFCVKLVDDSV